MFLGGWRSRYLYQRGCPMMLSATVAAGLSGSLTSQTKQRPFGSWKEDIKTKKTKTYKIQHTTLYRLVFLPCLWFSSSRDFVFFMGLFFIPPFLVFGGFFLPLGRSTQRRTDGQRTDDLRALPTAIDRAYYNRFLNERTSGQEDGTR